MCVGAYSVCRERDRHIAEVRKRKKEIFRLLEISSSSHRRSELF